MYVKTPIQGNFGPEIKESVKNKITGEVTQVEIRQRIEIPIGKLDAKIEKAIPAEDKKRLVEMGVLYKTEKEALTVKEPEGMVLADKKKDDETDKPS